MPPPLALLLCAAFVLFLLLLERRDSAGVSAASWLPTVWMLTISSKQLSYWLGSNPAASGKVLDQLLLMSLIVTGGLVLKRRRYDCLRALREQVWLMSLLAYLLASSLWSCHMGTPSWRQ